MLIILCSTQGIYAGTQPAESSPQKGIKKNAILLGACTVGAALFWYQFRSNRKAMYLAERVVWNNTGPETIKDVDPVKRNLTYAYCALGVLALAGMSWFAYKISTGLTKEQVKQWLIQRHDAVKSAIPRCFSTSDKQ